MSKQKISKEKSIRRAKTMTEAVISLVLVGTCAFFVKNTFSNMKDVGSSPYFDQNDIEIPDTTDVTVPDPNQTIYESFQVDTTDKFKGDLILVNEEHQYFGGDEDLVSITDMNYENEISCFTAVDSTYTILRQVYGPMAEMIQDFYDKYNNDTLIIYGSYRTTEFQQQLYEDDLAQSGDGESTRVAKPGFSEHETGLAFDFTESVNHDYDGTGDFAWINANCFKYGFIVRYTEAKQRLTKIQDEPWHFRYVGIPHAYYMDSKDLCLEEYIDLVREHPYDGEHLEFSDNEGNDYEVYFVASDDGSEKTTVPVPTGTRYEISGNNVDGFIVTVYKGQKPVVEEAPTKSFEDSETSEDETDSEDTGESTDESSGSEEY
ncbi:M15 family metallopeptidase [Ruminococcus sp.]|uniref:M15 family metallopeptidase n=1 Tax=Ruminococcus sp. TaxID=41978 RepID=UPI0025D3D9DE|nr:M15 family metallopeptidase [Ruminococcus sp.]MBR1430417.1 M15 family metallopeptidase [Ruminococcus sp.]